ncbi:MAG: hypothetical protein ABL908_08190 [Hyphomicrobium sp.]
MRSPNRPPGLGADDQRLDGGGEASFVGKRGLQLKGDGAATHEAQSWVLTVGGRGVRRFQPYRNLGEEMPHQSALILIHEPRALLRGGH